MRDLEITEQNECYILDNFSGEIITVFHSTIDTSLRAKYQSDIVNIAVNSKDPGALYNKQVEWGDKILTGFQFGAFSIKGKPFSCEKDHPDFNPMWRDLIKKVAGDILVSMCVALFGESNYVVKKDFFLNQNLKPTSTAGLKKKKKNT